jgi:ADP-heptose:LPS heptosyltransferase
MAVQLLRIVQGLGIQAGNDATDGARLPLRADACARVDAWLTKLIPHAERRFLLGLGIWSNMPAKRWPLERYAEVVGCLMKTQPKLFPIVLGGAEVRKIGEDLVRHWGEGAVAAGEFTIQESAHLLARCGLYLGNDTGIMHLADVMGTPCVAIFSARDQVGKWYPHGSRRNIVLRKEVPCAGCMLRECIQNQMRCLKEITVDEVFAACNLLLAQHGPPTL